MTELLTGEKFKRDLISFADPATEVNLKEAQKTSRIQMVRNGHEFDLILTHETGEIHARHANNKKYSSARSLLASPDFADIKSLISTQARLLSDFDIDSQIPPEGLLDGKSLALQTLTRKLNPSAAHGEGEHLRVLLLDGPAGVGKTSLIKRLVSQRARSREENSSAIPILHILSRGRRLSSLDESLAQSLQLIRAKFTFDQLPTLIRNGIVQLAIDGFDELVDPEGYRDAWYALRDFFELTKHGGPIILAGRDTFFDEQRFSAQMKGSSLSTTLTHVRLTEVSPTTAKSWLIERGWNKSDIEDPYTDSVLRPGSYTLRPYFLQELSKAKSWKAIESYDASPRAYLVDQFLQRESEILTEKIPLDVATIKTRLITIFEEIATEMSDTESDAIDISFLQMTTEIAFGDCLSETDLAKLRHKSGSFALLANDAREGFRRFPHSEIAHHFTSRALLRLVRSGEPTRFLRRGIVGSDLLAIFAELTDSSEPIIVDDLLHNLQRKLANESSFDRFPDNAASLLLTALCRSSDQEFSVSDLQASNVCWFGNIPKASISDTKIQRVDAYEANLSEVVYERCEISDLYVDETTKFGMSHPTVHRLHVRKQKGGISDLFDPTDIEKWISTHSISIQSEPEQNIEAIELLDKVCRVMLRHHQIKDHESDTHGRLLQSRIWKEVEKILTDENLLTRHHGKSTAGANAPFVRIRDPFALLANRGTGPASKIWKRIANIDK